MPFHSREWKLVQIVLKLSGHQVNQDYILLMLLLVGELQMDLLVLLQLLIILK